VRVWALMSPRSATSTESLFIPETRRARVSETGQPRKVPECTSGPLDRAFRPFTARFPPFDLFGRGLA
jgi:hypothetical protein